MIWIFGDSFANSSDESSWSYMLSVMCDVNNKSSNGSSEYRIWKNYKLHNSKIASDDIVIFCHTSPYRIFLKDDQALSSRQLSTHKSCDLIINDVFGKNETSFIELLKTIWDDQFFEDTYNLYVKDLKKVPNSIHLSFFDNDLVDSLKCTWEDNKGSVNHMNNEGNEIVLKWVLDRIKDLK